MHTGNEKCSITEFGLVLTREHAGGIQKLYRFPNNHGASVVRHRYSYGGDAGLWELAITRYELGATDEEYTLCYTTPITNDVLGYLEEAQVNETLTKIEALTG